MTFVRRYDKQIGISGVVGLFVAIVVSQVVAARRALPDGGLDMEGCALGLASFVVVFILTAVVMFVLLVIPARRSNPDS